MTPSASWQKTPAWCLELRRWREAPESSESFTSLGPALRTNSFVMNPGPFHPRTRRVRQHRQSDSRSGRNYRFRRFGSTRQILLCQQTCRLKILNHKMTTRKCYFTDRSKSNIFDVQESNLKYSSSCRCCTFSSFGPGVRLDYWASVWEVVARARVL